jgi:hypothetical protein
MYYLARNRGRACRGCAGRRRGCPACEPRTDSTARAVAGIPCLQAGGGCQVPLLAGLDTAGCGTVRPWTMRTATSPSGSRRRMTTRRMACSIRPSQTRWPRHWPGWRAGAGAGHRDRPDRAAAGPPRRGGARDRPVPGHGGPAAGVVACPVSSSGVHSGQAARAWVLSWASIRRSRSMRSVRVNFQSNGRAIWL